jgi:hypothetical protein
MLVLGSSPRMTTERVEDDAGEVEDGDREGGGQKGRR